MVENGAPEETARKEASPKTTSTLTLKVLLKSPPDTLKLTGSMPAPSPLAKYNQIKEGLEWLAKTYPLCFNFQEPRPLQVGIEKEIFAQGLWPHSRKQLRKLVAFYVDSVRYKKAIIRGEPRVSLNGEHQEDILDFQKEHAEERLQSYKSRRLKVKKKALQKAGGPKK